MAEDSAHPARVYNSIHKAPLQWVVGSYRLGMLSCFFIIATVALTVVSYRSLTPWVAWIPMLVLIYLTLRVIKAIHDADPDHALSEWTALRSITHGARHRYTDNYSGKD